MLWRPSLVLFALLALPALSMTVKVDPAGGAPRLVVDGQPVRARFFFGGPCSRPTPLPAVGGWVSEEFTAVVDEPGHGTLHFRFGQQPGTIILGEISITDLETGTLVLPTCDFDGGQAAFERQWHTWPTGAANTVGKVEVLPGIGREGHAGLKITLTAPPDGHWPDWHLYHHDNLALTKGHRYQLKFWAQASPAREVHLALYRPGQHFLFLGGPGDLFGPQIKMAGAAGCPFVSFPCDMPWPAPGREVDWSGVDAACETVLRANPAALLLPRVGLDAPDWWLKAHPEEAMVWDAGQHRAHAVPASPLYRAEAAARLSALVEHLEQRFPDRFAGIHPAGQNTGEWFYEDTWGPNINGYAPADTAGFRRWLAAHYADDPALRAAWRDPAVTLATAAVPSAAARHAGPHGVLRDPADEQAIIDFTTFQQESMAEWVCQMAHAVKQACGGRKLAVFFYGYLFEFGPVGTGPASSGHYALRRVLDCPDVDVLCSPISYNDRGPGGGAPSMTAAESVELAGKMWLNEDDTRTYLAKGSDFPGARDGGNDLAETNRLLVRDVAQEAIRNFATWWMDLGSTGWFNDPAMWAEMARFKAMDEALLAKPTPYRPEVAAVIDEVAMRRVAAGGQRLTAPGVTLARIALGRCGAPFGQYLQDDVAAGKLNAKLYVFLTPWAKSAEQRAALRRATAGAGRIWCYAPGLYDGDHQNPAAMTELCGFRLAPVTPRPALAKVTTAGTALGLTNNLQADANTRPLFAAADATPDETLLAWPDGSAAVALRKLPDGPSLFVGVPGLNSELVRLMARLSGAHVYAAVDANVYANGPFVAVHAAADGPLRLELGGAGPVFDALGGEKVGEAPSLTLDLKKGETRVLRRP
jgi:hypothetical protein